MFETKPLLSALASLIAAAALLSGCGGGAGSAEPATPAGSRADAAPVANAAPPGAPSTAKGGAFQGAEFDMEAPAAQSRGAVVPGSDGPGGVAKAPPEPKKDSGTSEQPRQQPGLGTEWGETRLSRITTSPFVRADPASPFATASLFYNDEAGAKALAGGAALQPISGGTFSVAGGTVSIGLKGQGRGFFNGFVAGGRQVVVGTAGMSYSIVVKNNTSNRFECVISVDGLDVLDGKAAAFTKRGYILDARGEIEVDGFRQSTDTVAAFRFGSVQSSYANQKHGETRNVGVIGVALFNEQAGWNQKAVQQRKDANPFPGN